MNASSTTGPTSPTTESAAQNGAPPTRTAQPSIISYQKLQARKSYFGLTLAAISQATRISVPTISAFLNGKEHVTLDTMKRVACVLRYRVRVDFEPFDADRNAFAAAISEKGIRFAHYFDPPRNSWVIIQESGVARHEIGLFYGLENERLAKFICDSLNGSS